MSKHLGASILVASVLVTSGCAPIPPLVIQQPIGPYDPEARPPDHGTLIVCSETESFDGDPDYPVHTR